MHVFHQMRQKPLLLLSCYIVFGVHLVHGTLLETICCCGLDVFLQNLQNVVLLCVHQ